MAPRRKKGPVERGLDRSLRLTRAQPELAAVIEVARVLAQQIDDTDTSALAAQVSMLREYRMLLTQLGITGSGPAAGATTDAGSTQAPSAALASLRELRARHQGAG